MPATLTKPPKANKSKPAKKTPAKPTTTVIPSLSAVNRVTATLTGPGEAFITVLVEDSTQR